MRIRRLILAVWLFLLPSFPVYGLNLNPSRQITPVPDSCPLADRVFNVAWLPKALNNQVFEIGYTGAVTRAAELSEAGPCPVDVLYTAPIMAMAEEQAELIEQVTQIPGIDAIGVSCIDPAICVEPINAAVAKALDIDLPFSPPAVEQSRARFSILQG